MAEEEEETPGANLDEEREQIRHLQSEQARKTEALSRLDLKIEALKSERDARQKELQQKKGEIENEVLRGNMSKAKDANASKASKDQAVSDFMRQEVSRMLQERIPILTQRTQDADELLALQDQHGEQQEEPAGIKERVHDTVLVSYINFPTESKVEDFKVSYRIGDATTVDELHRDACAYWGCSTHEFALCKLEGADVKFLTRTEEYVRPELGDPETLRLQSQKVLNPEEESHLHLINIESVAKFKEQKRIQEEKQKEKPKKEEEEENAQGKLKTLRQHGVVNEYPDEPFVESLRSWPGVYTLLKYRRRTHDRRAKIIKFRDIVIYGALALLSGFCILCRNSRNFFYLNDGAQAHLLRSDTLNFFEIKEYEDIWRWMEYVVQPQVFNNQSALRRFYTPGGYLRIRQQRAKEMDKCPRSDVPFDVRRPCFFVEVWPETQETDPLIFAPGMFIDLSIKGTGRMDWPDPRVWESAREYDQELYGYMQSHYDGSGYMVDYSLSAENISTAGETLLDDIPYLKSAWVTTATRMIVVEFALANFNMFGYVALSCLLEVAPSGTVHASANVVPFRVGQTYNDEVAEVLDIFRAFIIYGYILLGRVYYETKRKVEKGGSGLEYVFSFFGVVDASIIAMFSALLFERATFDGSPSPFELDTKAFNYSREGWIFQQMMICEGIFFLVVMVRWATFMRILSHVMRFWKVFGRSFMMFLYYCTIFVPVMLGLVFLAHSIWNPHMKEFATWAEAFVSTLFAVRQQVPINRLYDADPVWTLPYMTFFFFAMSAFFVHTFLAITVYAYFEVELLDGSKAEGATDDWTWDQWLDWMLWGRVYSMLTGREPGSSQELAEHDSDEEEDEEDEDADEK